MRRQMLAIALSALAAGGLAAEPKNVPELMKTAGGSEVKTLADWENVRRPEILKTFETQVFGVRPVERPQDLAFETVVCHDDALLSSAILKRVKIAWKGPRGSQHIVVTAFFPLSAKKKPVPCFVFLNRDGGAIGSQRLPRDAQVGSVDLDEHWPVTRILARGYATVAFDVTDVAEDDYSAFRCDVFGCFQDPEDRTSESWGTLSAWAWGASRVMDWLETEKFVDAKRVAVAGLSRRGKTALWAGATDRRFAMVCSCGSGTCGAKLNRFGLPPGSESLCRISRFRHWFCRNFDKWAGKDMTVPFDQHWMLALIAPRLLCVASGSEDTGACPEGEYWSTCLASPAWELYGKKGLVANGFPAVEAPLQEGDVSYHVRKGPHEFLLYDWERFMDFADKHGWRN